MNVFFILLSLSATPFPMIAMFVVMAAIMLGYSNSRKRKLTDALKWGIEVGDEVIATTGIRGRVEKVEEDVYICHEVYRRISNNVKISC